MIHVILSLATLAIFLVATVSTVLAVALTFDDDDFGKGMLTMASVGTLTLFAGTYVGDYAPFTGVRYPDTVAAADTVVVTDTLLVLVQP